MCNRLLTVAYKAVHDIDHNMGSYSESVPYMDEFFDFVCLKKSVILNKKQCVVGMPTWKGLGTKLGLSYIQSWPMMLNYQK